MADPGVGTATTNAVLGVTHGRILDDRHNTKSNPAMPEPIAYTEFVGGVLRPIFETFDGRQYVVDNDNEPVYGAWFVSRRLAVALV